MKKALCLFAILCVATLKCFPQGGRFQVKFSEPFAIFQFLDELSANAPPNVFKAKFSASEYNTEKYKKLILEYDHLIIDYGYDYTNYPYAQKIGGSTEFLLKSKLIKSNTVDDFKLSSVGVIPNADLFKLCDLLNAFEPVYGKLLYNPAKEKFDRQLNAVKNFVNSTRFSSFFDAGLRFYNPSWDKQIPFIIAVYPLTDSLHFSATGFFNDAVVSIPVELENDDKLFSVMIHEIFHILYDEESIEMKRRIEKAFLNDSSRNSRYAYLLLNEALATSLGNGYVYGKLKGAPDTGIWHRRRYINLIAKKIYPLVNNYIYEGKPLDDDFIRQYIHFFDGNFSGWLSKKDFLFTDRYVISDNAGNLNEIDQVFPDRSMAVYDSVITTNSIEKMKGAPITKIVVISHNNKAEIGLLKLQFKQLENWQLDSLTDFGYSFFLPDKTYLIILNNVKRNTVEQLANLTIEGS